MKNNYFTILCFIGFVINFLIFAADYTYDKDFMSFIHLLTAINFWTCGMIIFITQQIKNKK